MSTVTDITTLRRGSRRRVVSIDGEPWRDLASDVVRAAKIGVGNEISLDSLSSRIAAVEDRCARERAVRLLTYRDRSVRELRDRLIDDGYSGRVVDETVETMLRMGLVDDRRFAEGAARSLATLRGAGRDRVRRALLDKGIDAAIVQATLDEVLSEGEEETAARRLAGAAARRTGSTIDKVAARLVRRGYRPSLALRAAKEAFADRESDPEGSPDEGEYLD